MIDYATKITGHEDFAKEALGIFSRLDVVLCDNRYAGQASHSRIRAQKVKGQFDAVGLNLVSI